MGTVFEFPRSLALKRRTATVRSTSEVLGMASHPVRVKGILEVLSKVRAIEAQTYSTIGHFHVNAPEKIGGVSIVSRPLFGEMLRRSERLSRTGEQTITVTDSELKRFRANWRELAVDETLNQFPTLITKEDWERRQSNANV
jgi:hypothetical protein